MISICAYVFDPAGVLYIEREGPNTTGLDESARRASITRTLDGGVAVYDTGHSPADRTLRVHVQNVTEEQLETAARLVELYQDVTVAMRDGVFRAVPESRYRRNADLYFVLQFREKLS